MRRAMQFDATAIDELRRASALHRLHSNGVIV